MKTLLRCGLIVAGMLVVVGAIYGIFFHVWPFYPMWRWRYYAFGPRMWPVFPSFGMLILIIAGVLIAGYFFKALRDSSISKKNGSTFCPYCGKELRQERTNPEVQARNVP